MRQPELITNPKGLDTVIQEFQQYLSANISWLSHSLGRCYKHEKDGQFTPECYLKLNEYIEVFPDDSVSALSFFDAIENIDYEQTFTINKTAQIRLIFFINLKKIGSYSHRADENAIDEIETLIQENTLRKGRWKLLINLRETSNVFDKYNYNFESVDMQPFFVTAFEFEVFYNNKSIC